VPNNRITPFEIDKQNVSQDDNLAKKEGMLLDDHIRTGEKRSNDTQCLGPASSHTPTTSHRINVLNKIKNTPNQS
jgi:hypothetical protein